MILITGSTGYVGSHISEFFDQKKIEYIGIDNLSYSYMQNVRNNKKHFKIDISDSKKICKIFRKFNIDLVIHAAASSYVLEAEKNKKRYFINNVKKTKKFINLCKLKKIENFIFLSSSNVYEEKNIFSEQDKIWSKNYYGKNKIIIENFLKKKKFKSLIVLRLFNVIGLYNKFFKPFKFKDKKYQRIMFQIREKLTNNKEVQLRYFKINKKRVFPSRDFIDVKIICNIIEKIIKILNKKNIGTKFFNIGSGMSTPIDKIINNFEKLTKKKIKINYKEIDKKELIRTRANISKIKSFLNYKINFNLIKSLKSYIN